MNNKKERTEKERIEEERSRILKVRTNVKAGWDLFNPQLKLQNPINPRALYSMW